MKLTNLIQKLKKLHDENGEMIVEYSTLRNLVKCSKYDKEQGLMAVYFNINEEEEK